MSNKIYVGNLSFNTLEDSLRDAFKKYGDVESCKLITDRDSGRSKGFGFVEMASAQEAQDAISGLDGTDLDGRDMKVNEAKPQERRERSFGGNSW
ncbi:RNA-binding protein [Halobacteriovorax marinus]|uniref:RNA recognition motif domain-containing protein n=1 Tax=Halobacteriovorax marinus TaxID=97084 RepID=UPI000BC2DECD|nr:RNA-binding protein [Halobacteriovorax marinus]ATH07107.1 RNA-binding protein [Halobacteriovorax marinus]